MNNSPFYAVKSAKGMAEMIFKNRTVSADTHDKQLERHGNAFYPITCFEDDMQKMEVQWHWHDEFELILSYKGTIRVGTGQSTIRLEEGSACFINAGILHNVNKAETPQSILRSLVFHPKLIGGQDSIYWQKYVKPIMRSEKCQFVQFNRDKDEQIIQLLEQTWQAESDEHSGYELDVRASLSKFLFLFADNKVGERYMQTKQEIRDMQRAKQMIRFIEQYFSENLTVKRIASSANISPSECLRCFHRSVAMTPIQFLQEVRIRKAADLLETSEGKISAIATKSGFADFSYFSEVFRKKMGIAPKEYRKIQR